MNNSISIVFGVLSALGGLAGLAALFNVIIQRNKINAEAKKIGVDADAVMSDQAIKMYELARAESAEAKKEARDCRERMYALEDHVDHLERIMRDNGLHPPIFRYPPLSLAPHETDDGKKAGG